MTLGGLFENRWVRAERRIWADAKEAERLTEADRTVQLLTHGPTDAEWHEMAVSEERRMRLELDAKRTWADANQPAPKRRRRTK